MITGGQIRAARAFLKMTAEQVASRAKLGVATVRRAELVDGEPPITATNAIAIQSALEAAGIEFLGAFGNAPGVRLRRTGTLHNDRPVEEGLRPDQLTSDNDD
jgi:transcriptional regulator with XRE-family HTH domain